MLLSCCVTKNWTQNKLLLPKQEASKILKDFAPIRSKSLEDIVDSPNLPKYAGVKNQESDVYFNTMECIKNRLDSFEGKWPLPFINFTNLAESGFFYLQADDKVQCAFCRLILHSWDPDDDPLNEHEKHSPNCSIFHLPITESKSYQQKYLRSSSYTSKYVPLPTNVSSYKPKNPLMADISSRLQTFQNWHFQISAKDLAECGFYYSGNKDFVTCFSCGGSHGHWEATDDPFLEHAKYYPNCRFLRLLQNRLVQNKKGIPTQPQQMKSQAPRNILLENFLKSDDVKKAKKIFQDPPSLVENIIYQHFDKTGQIFTSLHELVMKIVEHEENQIKISSNASGKKDPVIYCQQSEATYATKPLKENYSEDVFLCKICMDEKMSIIFQPCNHYISCEKCASRVNECPVCRKPIENRGKVYLS